MSLTTGLPQFPDEALDPRIYASLAAIHLAINNLNAQASQILGIDANASAYWAALGLTGQMTIMSAAKIYLPTTVAITRGQVVSVFRSGGAAKLKLALAVSGAGYALGHGVANNSALIGEMVEVYWMRGLIDSIAGLTAGTTYYLSDTVAGAVTATMPSAAGTIIQPVGIANAAAEMVLEMSNSYSRDSGSGRTYAQL